MVTIRLDEAMAEIKNTEKKSIRSSLEFFGLVSFLIFPLYTFIIALGVFMFLSIMQLGFFGGEGEGFFFIPDLNLTSFFDWLLSFEWFSRFLIDSMGLLVIFYIYTIVVWIYVYYGTIKPIFYGDKEKKWSLGWYVETWFKVLGIFFIPAIMIVQILPFRAKNVPYKLDLDIRLFQ